MENEKDIYSGRFITSDDLGTSEPTLMIKGISEPASEKGGDGKPIEQAILWFEKSDKGLILGKTNFRILKSIFGPAQNIKKHAEKWKGQEITLMRRYIDCFGEKNVPVTRIKPNPTKPLAMGVRKHIGTEKPKGI
tara:strand:+ start:662 stop:1066 length:405 start_codon:yes stop_codon:yes gene_type:complete